MPELRCQECGMLLLPQDSSKTKSQCMCPNCGRGVYAEATVKAARKSPKRKPADKSAAAV
jgi:DNA-directed RNA polymerase subunit M/transcription elongation factor TFIIS